MRILRAAQLGMCFGVRDAIALAHEHADAGPLTILGDLVHNPTVLSALEAKVTAALAGAASQATIDAVTQAIADLRGVVTNATAAAADAADGVDEAAATP